MLTGLMDHWVPSHDAISHFWKTPFRILKPYLEKLCDEMAIDNFTFYTKWYSNGIKSTLPFLVNHPQAQNVVTDNAWGRELIDFFHGRGMTVGAMLQCYTFDAGRLPPGGASDVWTNTTKCTGGDRDSEIADPLWSGYPALLAQILDEELRLFPGLDAVFLEFEGVRFKPDHPLIRDTLGNGDPIRHVNPAIRELWKEIGLRPGNNPADVWLWTEPLQESLGNALRRNLAVAERVFERRGYTGIRGVVYYALGYEIPYAAQSLPNHTWWLLPWQYWNWGAIAPETQVRRELDFVQRRMTADIRAGRAVCYIGNATLPTEKFDTIEEMVRFSRQLGTAGYLGMGNPIPTYGLRWHGATEESVAAVRRLYCEKLFPKPG